VISVLFIALIIAARVGIANIGGAYHQLRSAISQVGGKKQLIGRTDIDIAIANQSNQCGRLIANTIIAYKSIRPCCMDQLMDALVPNCPGFI
jgi:hypothetical protein